MNFYDLWYDSQGNQPYQPTIAAAIKLTQIL